MKSIASSKLSMFIGIIILILTSTAIIFYYSISNFKEGGGEVPLDKSLRQQPPPQTIIPMVPQDTALKNPTISNSANDLVGNNNLEAIGLVWDRDERAAEYVLFRADSSDGQFTELRHIRAGIDIRTNTEDITPDARIKTLCYKIEARDGASRTIRIYEPICVPPWQK